MSTNKPRQLIEHISDQYVLSAVNPEQAFAREAEKRKKNHTKILAIACATAAVYVLIIVSIILGTRPSTPPEPPTPGTPGTENPGGTDITPPNQPNYTEPEINLPDAEFFQKHLSGFWEPEPLQVGDQHVITHYCFNFQSDGRVYIMDWNSSSKDSYPGRYSVTDDHIQIFTFDSAQGWTENKTFQIEIVGQPKQATHLLIGVGDHTFRYKRYSTKGGESVNLQIFDASPSAAIEYNVWDFYMERATMLTHETIDFQLPSQEYFKQLTPLKLESAPAFSLIWADAVSFKLYNRNMRLIAEGTSELDPQTGEFEIDFPNEDGLYYVDLICKHGTQSCITDSDIHFYVAIQIGEEKVDEPVTPPTSQNDPPPTLERVSEKECFRKLRGIWSSGELGQDDTYPIWYIFSPDGYFQVYDAQKNEGQMGVYSFDGSDIGLWLKDENGKWHQTDTKMTFEEISTTQRNLLVTEKDGTLRGYQSTIDDHYPVLQLVTFDTPNQSNRLHGQFLYQMYLGGIRTNEGKSITFELPSIGILYQTQPINVTDLTELTQFWIAAMAGVTDYTATFTAYAPLDNGKFVIEESGEIDLHPDYCVYSLAEIFDMSYDLYFVDICFEVPAPGDVGTLVWHYYVALQHGNYEPSEPDTPSEPEPKPEITLPDEPYLDYFRCMSEVYGMWIEGSWAEATVKDVIYYFSPDGYFYEMNIKTWESMMGVYYYYADGTILLFEANEKGDPVRQLPRHAVRSGGDNGVITVINTEDGKTIGTYTLGKTMPTTELLRVEIDKKSYLIPHMFPESFVWDEDHKFEFDTAFFVDKMQSVTHLTVTEAPILYIPLQGKGATYTLYIKEPGTSTLEVLDEGILIQEHGKMTLPDISGLYWDDDGVCLYLDIRFETGGYNAYCNQQFMHYFVALRCGEEEEAPSYTPPVLDDDRDILPITNCDVAPGGMFTLDTTSPAEGKGCWSTTMAPAIAFQKLETAINATGCDVIEFDLYISDLGALEVMKQNCALELSSGGQPDVQEIAFSGQQIVEFGRYGQEWKVGWNRVVLRLSDATPTNTSGNASFDISSINYVRFYLLSTSTGHTIKIDNICLSKEVK